jgi:hypothetical protein
MKLSRVLAFSLLVGAITLTMASSASANPSRAYSVLRCQPVAYSKTSGWQLGSPPPWSEQVYNWASQLYNASGSMESFRCSVDEDSQTPVSTVQVTGWSAGCVTGSALPQLTAYACKVPLAGGVGATCNFGQPVVGQSPDCTAGTKEFQMTFPPHVAGDALEVRVLMDVPYNGSSSAFWAYFAY